MIIIQVSGKDMIVRELGPLGEYIITCRNTKPTLDVKEGRLAPVLKALLSKDRIMASCQERRGLDLKNNQSSHA